MYKKRLLPLCIALAASGQLYAQTNESSSNDLVEEVEVTGVRAAELNAREEERSKSVFSSVISQDDAGNFADQNVAESLQRLPGITLQKSEGEGKFVSVRGLGPGFVSVSMNGSEMASAGGDEGRAFSLDALPSDMLGAIEVFKSLTPDMDLNSIGGAVNVKTVSAFDKKKDTFKMSAQGYYQEYSEEYSPKISLSGTNLFADDTIGVGYNLSYEQRTTEMYQNLHHQTTDLREFTVNLNNAAPSDTLLTPYQYYANQENAKRTRITGALDVEWRPTDNSKYFIRVNRTDYEDEDIAIREYYRFDEAAEGDFVYVDSTTNTFGVVDAALQKQFFIQDGTSSTTSFDIGGENVFNESWTLDYKYASSTSDLSKPDASRVQFRIRDLPILGQGGKDYIKGQIITPAEMAALAGVAIPSATTSGYYRLTEGRVQENLDYDNLFLEDSFRNDSIDQVAVNLKKDFADGALSYIKAGFLVKSRERDRNKDRWSVNPELYADFCGADAECKSLALDGTSGMFDSFTPNHPDIDYDSITRKDAEYLIDKTKNTALLLDPNRVGIDSTKDDYVITEDAQEAYVMAEFQLSEQSSLITGVRYVNTEFESSGNFAIRNDRFEDFSDQKLDIAVPLEDTKSSYDNWLPSIHYRYEPTDEILVRSSIWTSYTRPDFDQARAYANITDRVKLCNPNLLDTNGDTVCSDDLGGVLGATSPADVEGYYMSNNSTLNVGNPNLIAMTANNFDASIAWYPRDDLFLQAAVFYKDINDFIVEINGDSLALNELPIELPIDKITQFQIPENLVFDNVNYTTNGNKAEVYGIELSYSQNFDLGFFVSSNLTLITSSADVGESIRADKIQLPDQADQTANLTFGWGNDDIELRFISNYRSKLLKQIGACPDVSASSCKAWADIYQDASTTFDFKASYQVTDAVKVYFDALNLTGDKDLYYYEGNAQSGGNTLFLSEDFGSSYQLGINVKFK